MSELALIDKFTELISESVRAAILPLENEIKELKSHLVNISPDDMDIGDVCRYLDITRKTYYNWKSEGRIPQPFYKPKSKKPFHKRSEIVALRK